MLNKGKDTNGSQFRICLEPMHHLDGTSTVFGQVIGGLAALTEAKGPLVIKECGVR